MTVGKWEMEIWKMKNGNLENGKWKIGKWEMEYWKMGNGKLELTVPQSSSAKI